MELLTLEEVARLCRTSPQAVRHWRHQGIGPQGFKIGKRVLFRRDDVEAWLQAQHDSQVPA